MNSRHLAVFAVPPSMLPQTLPNRLDTTFQSVNYYLVN